MRLAPTLNQTRHVGSVTCARYRWASNFQPFFAHGSVKQEWALGNFSIRRAICGKMKSLRAGLLDESYSIS